MEALVLIFAEILLACLAPLLALAGAALAVALEAVLGFLALVFGGVFEVWRESRRMKREAAGRAPKAPRKPLVPRKVVHWAAGGLVALGAVGVLASVLFMQPILRYVMDTASARAGAEIRFERADGMLLTGDVTLYGITARRAAPEGLGFDMAIARLDAEVDVLTLLSRTPVISLAGVDGVTGTVSPPRRDPDKPRPEKKEKRPFVITQVDVKDVALEIRPKGSEAYPLVIETAEVAPFRSSTALFSLLFRSNMVAQIAGQDLRVETARLTERGRETRWLFEDVEAEKLQLLVPKAPLTWFSGGRLTARVEDRWSLSDDFVDMDWRIVLEDVRIQVPREAGRTEKLLGGALAKLVAAQGGNADFAYRLELDPEQIRALRSGDLDQFWDTVLGGFLKFGAKDEADEDEKAEEAGEEDKPGALDKLKNLLKKDEAAD